MKTQRSIRLMSAVLLSGATLLTGTGAVWAAGAPANPPAGSTFDQRLVQRKAEQNEQLDTKATTHLQQVCTTEQSSVRQLQPKATAMASNRNSTYQNIDGIVLVSIGQLKLASLDTFALEQDRAVLVQKISAFQATATNYQQALGDVLVVNCQADPVGFQALLDTSRAYYAQLATQSGDISAYLTNTIEPVLQTFSGQLQPKSSNGN